MVLATTVMLPDSTMRYIEDANRLVEVAVKDAIDRSIHQRRATIAPVTDTFSVNSNAHRESFSGHPPAYYAVFQLYYYQPHGFPLIGYRVLAPSEVKDNVR